ncbi:hypothetical protein ACMXZD_12040, partial [Pasteurella multocida]
WLFGGCLDLPRWLRFLLLKLGVVAVSPLFRYEKSDLKIALNLFFNFMYNRGDFSTVFQSNGERW